MSIITCKGCGKEISNMAKFCPYCGHKTRFGKEQEDRKGAEIIIYIGLIALIIGAVLFFPALLELIRNADDWYYWNWYTARANATIQNFSLGAGLFIGGIVCIVLGSRRKKW